MDCGDTFLMPAPGGIAIPHLWIVVTQPNAQTHLCAIVSVTTLRNSKDQTLMPERGPKLVVNIIMPPSFLKGDLAPLRHTSSSNSFTVCLGEIQAESRVEKCS